MKKTNTVCKDTVILGAALFSMFFGAGNMIFPPYLGLQGGAEWFGGFLGYFIADIGLAVITIIAQIRTGGFEGILAPLGRGLSLVIIWSIILCLGPLITVPRTAATTYELMPYAHNMNQFVFYAVFFGIVALLCINESGVVDIVGKILTPLLFSGLVYIIILGVLNPPGDAFSHSKTDSIVAQGIEAGYQSMDVLAATILGVLIIKGAERRGHTGKKALFQVTACAGFLAAAGLFVIYLGLTYLGATVFSVYDMHISKIRLLTEVVNSIIPGSYSQLLFAIVAGLACLSTAIALASSSAEYMCKLLKSKISYKVTVVIICIISTCAACLGVENLITFASPVLNIIYPTVFTVILLSFAHRHIGRLTYLSGALGAMAVSTLYVIYGYSLKPLTRMPFFDLGFGWVLPTFVLSLAGYGADKLKKAYFPRQQKKDCE